jgi:uncharacterized protein DUF5681
MSAMTIADPPQPEEQPEPPYRVGYRRPPLETRFRPGVCGNPRGRPKGERTLASVVTAALKERVTISVNGRVRRVSKLEAAVRELVNRAAAGEARATQLLLALVKAHEADGPGGEPSLDAADAFVMRELARRLGRGAP